MRKLVDALTEEIAGIRLRLATDETFAEEQAELAERINEDVLASALSRRPPRVRGALPAEPQEAAHEAADEDDEEGPEVVYVRD